MIKIIVVCLGLSFIWAILPVFGISKYSLEKSLTSCSIVWDDPSLMVLSYNATILVTVYLIPLFIILTANIGLAIMVCFHILIN